MAERIAESTRGAGGAVIDEAAARNASIELRTLSPDGRPITARARILGAEGDSLLLDHPQCAGGPVVFRRGQPLAARLRLNDAWYSFECDVVDAARLVRLNARKQVVGTVISRPAHVEAAAQRRNHFRVRFLAGDPIALILHEAARDGSGLCPLDARRFPARLMNLSAGGAGVLVARELARGLGVGAQLFLSFALPDEEPAFTFLVEVRQLGALPAEGEERMGLEIRAWPNPRQVERTQQRLQRYLTRVQRGRVGNSNSPAAGRSASRSPATARS